MSSPSREPIEGQKPIPAGETLPPDLDRPARPNGRDLLIGIGGLLVVIVVLRLLISGPPESEIALWGLVLLQYSLIMGWQLVWPAVVRRSSAAGRGAGTARPIRWLRELGAASLALVIAWIVIAALRLVWPPDDGGPYGKWGQVAESGAVGFAWFVAFIGVFIGPLAEEVFFRGLVQRYFQTRLAAWVAILLTSILFSIYHTPNLRGGVEIGVMGIVLGSLYVWRGSLVAPVALHMVNNAVAFVVLIAATMAVADRPLLGVMFDETDSGVVIVEVMPETGASEAGLPIGGILRSVDGLDVEAVADVLGVLGQRSAGDVVRLVIRVEERDVEFQVRLMRLGDVFRRP